MEFDLLLCKLLHAFLQALYNLLIVVSLLLNLRQLHSVLSFDLQFLLELMILLAELNLLLLDLLLQRAHLLLFQLNLVLQLLLPLACKVLVLLVGHFKLGYSLVQLLGVFVCNVQLLFFAIPGQFELLDLLLVVSILLLHDVDFAKVFVVH